MCIQTTLEPRNCILNGCVSDTYTNDIRERAICHVLVCPGSFQCSHFTVMAASVKTLFWQRQTKSTERRYDLIRFSWNQSQKLLSFYICHADSHTSLSSRSQALGKLAMRIQRNKQTNKQNSLIVKYFELKQLNVQWMPKTKLEKKTWKCIYLALSRSACALCILCIICKNWMRTHMPFAIKSASQRIVDRMTCVGAYKSAFLYLYPSIVEALETVVL